MGPPVYNTTELIITLTIEYIINIIGIIGNALIMLTVYTYPGLRTRSMYFLVWLSVTDMAVCLIIQSLTMVELVTFNDNCWLLTCSNYISFSLCFTSINLLALISYDRYIHLSKLNNYNRYMTSKKVRNLVIICWVPGLLIGCLLFSHTTIIIYSICVMSSGSVILLFICRCYYKSWKIFISQSRNIRDQSNNENISKRRDVNEHWKVVKSTALLIASLIIAWCPYTVFILIQEIFKHINYDIRSYKITYTLHHIVCMIGFSNSSINPFLYYWKNKRLLKGMKRFVRTKVLRLNNRVGCSNSI